VTAFRCLVALLILLPASASLGQTPEQLFREANQLYQQGKVPDARDLYEKILSSGYSSGELYYNLGNAYYKTGSLARAILNYERAMRLIGGDEDVRHNLQLANMMTTDRIEPIPKLFVWDYWQACKDAFSLRSATLFAYLFYVLVAGAAALFLLARTYALRKVALLSGGGALVAFCFCALLFASKLTDATRTDEAVLMAQIATVKNSPDPKSSDAFVLHGGSKVQLIDHLGSWSKIRLADGKVGWVEAASLEVI